MNITTLGIDLSKNVFQLPPASGKLSPLISINSRGRERSPYETGQ